MLTQLSSTGKDSLQGLSACTWLYLPQSKMCSQVGQISCRQSDRLASSPLPLQRQSSVTVSSWLFHKAYNNGMGALHLPPHLSFPLNNILRMIQKRNSYHFHLHLPVLLICCPPLPPVEKPLEKQWLKSLCSLQGVHVLSPEHTPHPSRSQASRREQDCISGTILEEGNSGTATYAKA